LCFLVQNAVAETSIAASGAKRLGVVKTIGNSDSTERLAQATTENRVTSISQLSDVQPSDWAYQALQSLVERYGVVAGYLDGNYKADRAMTRYEFAAALNAALERVNELIAAGLAGKVLRDDFSQ
jgi:hypothetical protein